MDGNFSYESSKYEEEEVLFMGIESENPKKESLLT